MSNVGKRLREETASKFESDPFNSLPTSQKPPLKAGGFGELITESQKQAAGSGFSQDGMIVSPFANDHFNSKLLGFDLGEVMGTQYDDNAYNNVLNPEIDFDKLRADNQSAASKLGSLAAQFVGKTAVGTVGNIVGSIYGLGHAVLAEDGDINSVWDNEIYRSLDEMNESIESKNSLFVHQNDGLGFNFKTFKEVNDAFSFIAGAAMSEIIMQTAGNAMGGAGIATLPLRFTKYGKQIGKMMKMLDNAEDIEKLALKLGATKKEMSRLKRISDISKTLTNGARRALTTTGYEASLEARGAKDELVAHMIKELDYELARMDMSEEERAAYREAKLKEIEQAGNSAGMMTFGLNTAVLGISNAIQFPKIFGDNFTKNVYTGNLIRKGISEIGQKQGKKAATLRYMGMAGRILKNPATEFMEETLQGVASNFSQNHFELMLGSRTQAGVLSPYANKVAESVYGAVTDTYGTSEGLHEGVIGAIVGTLGLPGLKKGKKGRKFTMHGGIAESIREERERSKQIENAISSINNTKMSDVLKYNKDNAILATLDAQREDLASITNNKVEFDSINDAKVFRYTQDRMEKGMEEFIDQDITEMREMVNTNFEKYKQAFGKDEAFTQEEANKELDAFENKVKVYKNAYKAVHRRYNLNLMRTDDVTKTLTDVLTHAVATEQVFSERLDVTKNKLFEMLNGQFTKEEINEFVATSGKIGKINDVLDNYISEKQAEKESRPLNSAEAAEQEVIRMGVPNEYKHILDMDDAALMDFTESIKADQQKDPNSHSAEKIAAINKAVDVRDNLNKSVEKARTFQANKSNKVSAIKKDIDELTKVINDEITARTSKAMSEITAPPKKITRKELQDYIDQKSKIIQAINKEFDSKGVYQLGLEDHQSAEELINEMYEITDKHMTAVSVAAHLYGFKNNPSKAYAKILTSRFYADFDNADRLSHNLDLLMEDGAVSEEFKTMLQEYKDIIASMEEELGKIAAAFGDIKDLKAAFKVLKNKIKKYDAFGKTKEQLDNQQKNATKTAKKKASKEELKPGEVDFGDTIDEDEEDGDGDGAGTGTGTGGAKNGGDTKKGPQAPTNRKNNRFTIRENSSFVKEFHPDFKEKLAKGKFKTKAAVTLSLAQDSLDPEKDAKLKAYLTKEGVLDSYKKGLALLTDKDPEELLSRKKPQDLDPDVYTFIRYAPITMNIYDKVLKPDNKYSFEITTEDKPIFTQDRFFKADDILKADEDAVEKEVAYHKAMEKLYEDEQKELDDNKIEKSGPVSKIHAKYIKLKKDIEEKYKASQNNSHSNYNFRQQLIKNAFIHDNNLVKLKIQSVDQGNLEVFNFEDVMVNENHPKTLGYDPATMTLDDIYYGNSKGDLLLMARPENPEITNTKKILNHPFSNMTGEGINGKLFFKYKDQTGKEIPIKMNTSKFDGDHIKIIHKVLNDFFNAVDQENFVVRNSGIPFLDKRELKMNEFMEFFMRQKSGPSTHVIFLNNTFNIKPIKDTPGKYHAVFYNGDVESLVIRSAKDLEVLSDTFTEEMANSRFTINKRFILNEDQSDLDHEVLQYYFDKGLINHAFNVNDNFDKVFSTTDTEGKPYNKGIALSFNDTPDTPTTIVKPESYDNMIRELRQRLGNATKKTKHEPNLTTINNAMMYGVMNSIRKQTEDLGHDPSDAEINTMIATAVNNITDKKLNNIKYVTDRLPHKYKYNGDHATNQKIQDDDTEIDKFLRVIYAFKNKAYKSNSFITQARREAKTWGSKSTLLKEFSTVKRRLPINTYGNRKANEVKSQLTSKEQFDNVMEMVYLLKDLTDLEKKEGNGYIHITYSDDYVENVHKSGPKKGEPLGPETWKLMDQTKLTADNKLKGHYKTRLTSVTIDGVPRFENGKIVGGSVYLNVRTWNRETKKAGGHQLILFADSEKKAPKSNLIISLGLPFMNSDFTINDKTLSKKQDDIVTRKNAREKNDKQIKLDAQAAIGRKDIDLKKLNSLTSEDGEGWGESELDDAFSDVVDENGNKVEPPAPVVPQSGLDMSSYLKGDKPEEIKEIITENMIFYNEKDMDDEMRIDAKDQFNSLGIKTPDELVLIYDMYKNKGILKDIKDFDKFAEYVFAQAIKKC